MERKEWLQWRKFGIGSSDAPVLHGYHEYNTPLDLYHEKQPETPIREEASSFVQAKGNRLEQVARVKFSELISEIYFKEINMKAENFELENANFMRASFDLFTIVEGMKGPIRIGGEVKYLGPKRHVRVIDESLPLTVDSFDPDVLCRIPRQYWIQIQHQYLVGGVDVIYFVSQVDEDSKPNWVVVPKDEEFIANHLKVCADFWRGVLTKEPPEIVDADFKTIRVKGAVTIARQLANARAQKKKYESKVKALEAKIKKIADEQKHPRLVCGPLKFLQCERIGNINYKNIPAIAAMNDSELDSYRAKSSIFWKISSPGQDDAE